MENSMRIKLFLYAIISSLSYTYLALPENAGISILIFAVIQFVFLLFVMPDKKRLWLFIPIFILALNSFISGNAIWRVPNVIVGIVLFCLMILDIDIKGTTLRFIGTIFESIIKPIKYFAIPFKWGFDANKEKASIVKRVLISIVITIPCLIILVATLSLSDMIFSQGVTNFFKEIIKYINLNIILKSLYGFVVGLYLFGLVYSSYFKKSVEYADKTSKQGDLIILNILLISVLIIYTIFVVIQFKYLFAGASLPYGLTYTQYARKGFFELLALSLVNTAVILLTIFLTKENSSKWSKVTKWLCCYLCTITIILLISSFYRMWLYNYDDGLTRLRYLVFGFLIFECLGLIITFFYIFKPKFNIVAVYLLIGLVYYLLLNIIPMDYFVAKSQVDRYLSGGKSGIPYTVTLSTDAASQIKRLIYNNEKVDIEVEKMARFYFENANNYYSNFIPRWQRYNISVSEAQEIYRKIIRDDFILNIVK